MFSTQYMHYFTQYPEYGQHAMDCDSIISAFRTIVFTPHTVLVFTEIPECRCVVVSSAKARLELRVR